MSDCRKMIETSFVGTNIFDTAIIIVCGGHMVSGVISVDFGLARWRREPIRE